MLVSSKWIPCCFDPVEKIGRQRVCPQPDSRKLFRNLIEKDILYKSLRENRV